MRDFFVSPQAVLSQTCRGTELNSSITNMVPKDAANDIRNLDCCHYEFRGLRSDNIDLMALEKNNMASFQAYDALHIPNPF
ncbi:hypothetical protein TNCV_1942731 [Trichonephila clavipes]|nr:hypothetical protein TNCV_1942731 [Trichonephila clavipes]